MKAAAGPLQPPTNVLVPNPHLSWWDQRLIDLLVVMVVSFSVLPSGFSWSLSAEDIESMRAGSFAFQAQWGSVLLLSAYLLMRHARRSLALFRQFNPFLLLLCAYTLVGVFWSPAPASTVKKALQFFELMMMAVAVQLDGRRWTHHALVVGYVLTAIMAASAVAALAVPTVGIDSYFGYAWRGVLANKNTLGGIAAITVVYLVGLWQAGALPVKLRWPSVLLAMACVVLSTSSTSFLMMCLGLVVVGLVLRQHIRSPLWLLRIVVVVGLFVTVFVHVFYVVNAAMPGRVDVVGPVAALFGKGADMTGRSDIWDPLFIQIQRHWILGVGYGAFWLGPGSESQPILDTLSWIPFQGHNNYLDLANELGAVGVVLVFLATVLIIRQLFALTQFDRVGAAMFSAVLATFYVGGFSETHLFRSMTPQFVLYMMICASLSAEVAARENQLRQAKLEQRRARLVRASRAEAALARVTRL